MKLRVSGPFGLFGAMAGMAAGAIFVPSGCTISEAESLRLRCLVPLLTPFLAIALGHFVAKRRRVMPWLLLAAALWCVLVGTIGEGPRGLYVAPIVAAFVGPGLVIGLAGLWLLVRQARSAAEARPDTPPAQSGACATWAVAIAAASPLPGARWLRPVTDGIDPTLAWIATTFGIALAAAAMVLFVMTRRAERRLARMPKPPPDLAPVSATSAADLPVIDFGVGVAWRELAVSETYRQPATNPDVVWNALRARRLPAAEAAVSQLRSVGLLSLPRACRLQITPNFLPTFSKASSARSRCLRSWVAM